MDSDEVNSISDTTESMQVARLCRGVYYDCATDMQLAEHEGLFELTPSSDITQPIIMTLPSNVAKIYWIKYNHKLSTEPHSNYKEIEQWSYLDFYKKQQAISETTYGLQQMIYQQNGEDFEIKYLTYDMPLRYTELSNNQIIFNSIDISEDTVLQKSKTMCGGLIYPSFLLEDTFYPPLDSNQFSYYVNKCKVRAFYEIKQVENREAGGEALRQKIAARANKNTFPNDSGLTKQKRNTGYGR